MLCGTPTRRKTRYYQKAKNERYGANPTESGGAIGLLLTWLIDYASGKMHQEVALEVPQCDECHQRGQNLRVRHVDFDQHIVTFIVHRNFRQALEASKSS
jgi:hypothetical protein